MNSEKIDRLWDSIEKASKIVDSMTRGKVMSTGKAAEDFDRLWDSIEDDLGFNDCNMRRDRPYDGQPHTDTGIRGKQELIGVTMRDIRDCFVRACFLASGDQCNGAFYHEATKGEHAVLSEKDLYKLDFDKMDPMAICRNLTCEIERIMGIFPNVPSLKYTSDPQ